MDESSIAKQILILGLLSIRGILSLESKERKQPRPLAAADDLPLQRYHDLAALDNYERVPFTNWRRRQFPIEAFEDRDGQQQQRYPGFGPQPRRLPFAPYGRGALSKATKEQPGPLAPHLPLKRHAGFTPTEEYERFPFPSRLLSPFPFPPNRAGIPSNARKELPPGGPLASHFPLRRHAGFTPIDQYERFPFSDRLRGPLPFPFAPYREEDVQRRYLPAGTHNADGIQRRDDGFGSGSRQHPFASDGNQLQLSSGPMLRSRQRPSPGESSKDSSAISTSESGKSSKQLQFAQYPGGHPPRVPIPYRPGSHGPPFTRGYGNRGGYPHKYGIRHPGYGPYDRGYYNGFDRGYGYDDGRYSYKHGYEGYERGDGYPYKYENQGGYDHEDYEYDNWARGYGRPYGYDREDHLQDGCEKKHIGGGATCRGPWGQKVCEKHCDDKYGNRVSGSYCEHYGYWRKCACYVCDDTTDTTDVTTDKRCYGGKFPGRIVFKFRVNKKRICKGTKGTEKCVTFCKGKLSDYEFSDAKCAGKGECHCFHCKVTPFEECEYGEWGEFSRCSAPCGRGHRVRNRKLIKGDKDKCKNIRQIRLCHYRPCPNHCMWTYWSPWLPCSKPCGYGGVSIRIRSIMSPPVYGGRPCYGPRIQRRPCNRHRCYIRIPKPRIQLYQYGSQSCRHGEAKAYQKCSEWYKGCEWGKWVKRKCPIPRTAFDTMASTCLPRKLVKGCW